MRSAKKKSKNRKERHEMSEQEELTFLDKVTEASVTDRMHFE